MAGLNVAVLLQNNVVYFRVAGLGLLSGNLSIKASYAVESDKRVSIKFIESTLVSEGAKESLSWGAGQTADWCAVVTGGVQLHDYSESGHHACLLSS